jgi:hypothetical protein
MRIPSYPSLDTFSMYRGNDAHFLASAEQLLLVNIRILTGSLIEQSIVQGLVECAKTEGVFAQSTSVGAPINQPESRTTGEVQDQTSLVNKFIKSFVESTLRVSVVLIGED